MSSVSDEYQFLGLAWRFALLLTGCREGAARIFQETAGEISRHPQPGDARRTRFLFFAALRRRGLKFPARNELDGFPRRLHAVAEPGRTALALLYLDALPIEDIARALDLNQRGLADTLDKARAALASIS